MIKIRKGVKRMSRGEESRLLTVPEVARRLRLSRNHTYILLGRGDLPRIKVGGAVRIDSLDLEAYIQAHRETRREKKAG
jgi:excisionase family DNA binding protein